MNQYARTVRSYYTEHRPDQAATMSDADFVRIGETIAAQIVDLSRQLEGPDDPTETHLAKVGRLNWARASATETVLQQWLTPSSTRPGEEDPDPEMDAIWWALDRVRNELQEGDEPD